ncbi:hypothetical protein OIU85_005400 [Salix viminalis]|uniref:Aldehyde dehydrogenase domain-containing protein n=1 Tax=Salix viminalis TaxID=40686 RepID=A0A9Q0PIV3_SALVM|nr:hypothetical protein OIU85_005400 [Salix viminalis]
MAIRGSGSCTLLTLTPSIRVKRGIAIFATLSPPRNDSTVNWLADVCREDGLPPGVLNILTGFGTEAGAPLASHPHVDKVAFTGSNATGSRIMASAAQMVKPVSMELGGKSPFIVCEDVDLDKAAEWTLFGVCNLCNGGVRFVRDNDRNRRIRYEALQSKAGRKLLRRSGRAPDDISSVVLVERDRSHIKSEAVLKIMEYIDLPFPQLAFFLQFVPLFLRDFVYDNVANNRYTIFGRSESCEIYYD